MVGNANLRVEIEAFLKRLQEGVPSCMLTGIWFGEPRADGDLWVSTYWDHAAGMERLHDKIQEVPTNRFHWFMPQIRATKGKSGRGLMVISDYDLIPDDAPLKEFYPPDFVSVADYVVWEGETFPGWVGILSTKTKIDWSSPETIDFISRTIDSHRPLLLRAYHDDFMPQCRSAALARVASPGDAPQVYRAY
jgi:hypothetical protein